MENATKALLIAGGVLISIVIISMLMLMFNNLNNYQQNRNDEKRVDQTLAFNQQYEGYARDDVRGNELISLINKVVDYNYRKSSVSSIETDHYQQIEITIDLKDDNNNMADFSRGEGNKIFTTSPLVFNDSSTAFKSQQMMQELDTIKTKKIEANNGKYTLSEEKLKNLVVGYDKIFISNNKFNQSSDTDKVQIFSNFNSAFGQEVFKIEYKKDGSLKTSLTNLWKVIDENSSFRADLNKYYEYVQFKRAHYKCISTEYNTDTGRIVKMQFKFTGEFN